MFETLKEKIGSKKYEENKKALLKKDPEAKMRIARDPKTQPEILFYMAVDPSLEVRAEVAKNPETPIHASQILSKDPADVVRENLSKRIDSMLPNLSKDEHSKVCKMTISALENLAKDQVTKIRQMVADVIKDNTDVPNYIIKDLAKDPDLKISMTILQESPLLTDEDLLDIISQDPESKKIPAIAKRKNVSTVISDSIVASKNIAAVSALLENDTAQIREETLDMIIDQAPSIQQWHRPLVRRPKLPDRVVSRIINFVSEGLLDEMSKHQKLDNKQRIQISSKIKDKAHERVNMKEHIKALKHDAMEWAKLMKQQGKLNEKLLEEQILHNHKEAVIAGLSVLSKIPVFVLNYALVSGNAKLVCAVSWKSSLSMKFAVQLQRIIGKIPEDTVIHPQKDSKYPITTLEMENELQSLYK